MYIIYSVIAAILVAIVIVPTIALWVLQTMHSSVGIAAPMERQCAEESDQRKEYPLFRHYPEMANHIAWRALGKFPTPLHFCKCQAIPIMPAVKGNDNPGSSTPPVPRTVQFYVKREDLSSSVYGGNKVRTLQHQLAVLESKLERQLQQNKDQPRSSCKNNSRILRVFGSGGSNQVLATALYALRMKLPLHQIQALWIADPPDLDNTLNMLSTLSLEDNSHISTKNQQPRQEEEERQINQTDITFETWGKPLGLLRSLLSACISTVFDPNNSFILTLGGNNPAGVIGQISGALELAEQVQQGQLGGGGERRRVDGIYVAVGSSCTITGLILGVAIARRLGLDAFGNGYTSNNTSNNKDDFRLHMVPIEDTLAMLHRWTGLYTRATFARFIPLTIRHSLHATCKVLVELGGPDVLVDALAILEHETVVHANAHLIGKYGAHSEPSKACARLFDDTVVLKDEFGSPTFTTTSKSTDNKDSTQEIPALWLCGHFTAKPMAVLCDHLLKEAEDENSNKTMIFWQTKSVVQPRGTKNEWNALQHEMPVAVQEWANKGEAQSTKRPGTVDLVNGSPKDYRHLMTKIEE
jgi:1-aminocyclopropane-1-carboxylate deaminase/D-cysteine desulfhydrase-like pyridoxal-dependent ACC family enzyme